MTALGQLLKVEPEWTLEQGLVLVRELQQQVRQFNYHIALGGGVLNNGESYKDLDLFFLPMNIDAQTLPVELLTFLNKQLGPASSIGDGYVDFCGTYGNKVMFIHEGQRIDAFIV